MSRRDELIALVPEDTKSLTLPMIEEILFLEAQLTDLRRLPFIQVNPKNTMQQRATPAAKQYKEFLQQYINCVKAVEYAIYKDKRLQGDEIEESPLRKWFNEHSMDA